MSLKSIYQVEKGKWNELAKKKEKRIIENELLKPGEDFYAFNRISATHVGVNEFLGDLSDKHVLEYGCGLGQMSSLLAKDCPKVTTFDISKDSIHVTKKRAQLNEVDDKIEPVVSAGENLPFATESFDIIFGKAILHHLNVSYGGEELYRVLKPGGKAVFVEPMGMNPVLNFARDHLPYFSKNPRGADSPLIYDEIYAWGRCFRKFRFQEVQLLGMLERILGRKLKLKFARKLDAFLLRHMPFLRKYCRYVVLYMEK